MTLFAYRLLVTIGAGNLEGGETEEGIYFIHLCLEKKEEEEEADPTA